MRAPERCPIARPNQLHAHPQAVAGVLNRAGEQVVHRQLAPDRPHIHIAIGIAEHGRRGPEAELAHSGQATDDRVRHADGERQGLAAAAERAEREYREWNGVGRRPRRGAPHLGDDAHDCGHHQEGRQRGRPPAPTSGAAGHDPGLDRASRRSAIARHRRQGRAKVYGAFEPATRIARERAGEDRLQGGGELRPRGPQCRRIRREPRDQHRLRRGPRERWMAGQHLVEYAPQRIDVRPGIELALAAGLLRAHVGGSAEHHAGLGHRARRVRVSVGRPERLRDPEVGHQRVAP